MGDHFLWSRNKKTYLIEGHSMKEWKYIVNIRCESLNILGCYEYIVDVVVARRLNHGFLWVQKQCFVGPKMHWKIVYIGYGRNRFVDSQICIGK